MSTTSNNFMKWPAPKAIHYCQPSETLCACGRFKMAVIATENKGLVDCLRCKKTAKFNKELSNDS